MQSPGNGLWGFYPGKGLRDLHPLLLLKCNKNELDLRQNCMVYFTVNDLCCEMTTSLDSDSNKPGQRVWAGTGDSDVRVLLW